MATATPRRSAATPNGTLSFRRFALDARVLLIGGFASFLTAIVFAVACAPRMHRGPLASGSSSARSDASSGRSDAAIVRRDAANARRDAARASAIAHPEALRNGTGATTSHRFGRLDARDREALIALAGRVTSAPVSSSGAWEVDEQGGSVLLVRGNGGEPWRIERRGPLLRIAGEGGDATPWREGPFIALPTAANAVLEYNGHRYRGELWFTATDTGILVVNRLPVEDYLRGVVPLELGTNETVDQAALEAQAIAARSYTYARVPAGELRVPRNGWHMLSTVSNQVYGGMDAEKSVSNAAIDATSGLVLRYAGLIVDAPYYSSCGGRTAEPTEAWRDARDEPYLQSVSDINPATGRAWCEGSPRDHWTAEIDEARLDDVARRALAAAGVAGSEARVQDIQVSQRTTSGRVGKLVIRTDRGEVALSASDIRSVFRDARGAILSSTYFSVDRVSRERGHLTGVTLRGAGYGHGVGMCQWGAIGRARAGQDSREILRHYYPGTVVGFAD